MRQQGAIRIDPPADPARTVEHIFLSPLRAQKLDNHRVRKVTMRMLTAGQPAVITLSYPDLASAKAARAGLLAAGNVHAVPTEVLWRAIAAALKTASLADPE